ncbi:MAG: MBL fold metallo-hydrolase [Acidobacteriota bacterium]|nr:MBL fold metallo-hydrolase [Blastocatellia bacterium]MDW8411292.1 MBL fold metallo-hydrolase [Acidobacteriota bacterium]
MILGDFLVDIVSDGSLRLDGGAMFGVVPRVLWAKLCAVDDLNRIEVALNCLLVRYKDQIILVDTGAGNKWSEKHRRIYALSCGKLVESLKQHDIHPEDITMVINTHLHFDHAGGNTTLRNGQIVPTFPNARYIVQRAEYEHACRPHERDRASYISDDWEPIKHQLELIEGDCEIIPGLEVFRVPGHNLDTQLVRISSGNLKLVFFADIIPTSLHLPYAWVMAYDLYPVELVEQKKRLVPQAEAESWICIFEHDPVLPAGRIVKEKDKYKVLEEACLKPA